MWLRPAISLRGDIKTVLVIIGTVPDADFPLIEGTVTLKGKQITVGGYSAEVNRGTPALIAAVIKTLEVFGLTAPTAFLVGDTGLGDGSRRLYRRLTERLPDMDCQVLCFHYLQPDVDWHYRVMSAVEKIPKRPLLIADAGFMYAAKMADAAESYDLFTPDAGELSFLADEEAPHPFYTRGFILHEHNDVKQLIKRAYQYGNAARTMIVKGAVDYITRSGGIESQVDQPVIENLEPIGGTGDTVTGIAAALISTGMDIVEAAILAAKTNRLAGFKAAPSPASQVLDIINHVPEAMTELTSPNKEVS